MESRHTRSAIARLLTARAKPRRGSQRAETRPAEPATRSHTTADVPPLTEASHNHTANPIPTSTTADIPLPIPTRTRASPSPLFPAHPKPGCSPLGGTRAGHLPTSSVKAKRLGAALLSGLVAATAMVLLGLARLEVASAASVQPPDVPTPVPQFSWPLGPPHPVVRPFVAPATPYGPGHRGVDLGGTPGEPVFAAADGVIVFAGDLAGRGVLSIDHAGGLRTTYEPIAAAVVAGQRVVAGAVVGHLQPGHPGCPVAACLHWGVRRSAEYLDPLALVLKVRVRLLPWDP